MSAIQFQLEAVEIAKKGWRVPKLRFFIRKDTSDQKSLDETIRKNTYLKKGVTVELELFDFYPPNQFIYLLAKG